MHPMPEPPGSWERGAQPVVEESPEMEARLTPVESGVVARSSDAAQARTTFRLTPATSLVLAIRLSFFRPPALRRNSSSNSEVCHGPTGGCVEDTLGADDTTPPYRGRMEFYANAVRAEPGVCWRIVSRQAPTQAVPPTRREPFRLVHLQPHVARGLRSHCRVRQVRLRFPGEADTPPAVQRRCRST
jgi:hypothetical protein